MENSKNIQQNDNNISPRKSNIIFLLIIVGMIALMILAKIFFL